VVDKRRFLVTTRVKVRQVIEEVAKEHQQTLAPLVDELALFNSGLDSLSLAVIVVRLEDEFMVDPFSGSDATGAPKTVGDFVVAYERAIERAAAEKARA
jgi:acyl carrier protein